MFTGIIEDIGVIKEIHSNGSNKTYTIESAISNELHVDQSVAHEGVCLTVIAVKDNSHQVTAVKETLDKSVLGNWKEGHKVNLERCMKNDGRFDGHIVQGHVDTQVECMNIEEQEGSWLFNFKFLDTVDEYLVEKGSVTINGISLTCFNVSATGFSVAIIPYTYSHTTMNQLQPGDQVNIEFDIIGKYVKKLMSVHNK